MPVKVSEVRDMMPGTVWKGGNRQTEAVSGTGQKEKLSWSLKEQERKQAENKGRLTPSGNILLWTEEAYDCMASFFGIGETTKSNVVEQGGEMYGFYLSREPGCVQAVAVSFVPAENAAGTAAHLDWPAVETVRMDRIFFEQQMQFRENDPDDPRTLQKLGWIHSHPNGLPVFLSGEDMANISRSYNRFDQFSVVLNPHKKIWKTFLWKDTGNTVPVMILGRLPETKKAVQMEEKKIFRKKKASHYGQPRGNRKHRKHGKR